ncbi:type II toxin-antitoxin system VapB family antitoxin [Cryptosporangium minutisporangium]|uniref:Antitoxin n=1 Tax=Cryptosporangium minutisporangium TaxID=113569 RepID=A0ABP6T7G9_9ACTN
MPNILIRDLSQEAVDRIDAAASNLGLSRNEYLRRKFEEERAPTGKQTVTAEDWQRSAEVFSDLADPTVTDAAWR